MKLEFSLTSKVNPSAEMKLGIDCSAEELSVIISDPVYQALGMKLVQEVSLQPNDRDRVECMRKVYEADRKAQHSHNAAVDQAIRGIQDQISRMLDEAVRKF